LFQSPFLSVALLELFSNNGRFEPPFPAYARALRSVLAAFD
jgi:hypothetical protein